MRGTVVDMHSHLSRLATSSATTGAYERSSSTTVRCDERR